ncbi:porin [Azospirillum sp. sgz302134]
MKRSLVIGCAALALAAGCGTASAQSKFDVVIGGDAFFQGAYVDQKNDAGLRSTEFSNRYRLVVTPTAKADNGLEYGGRVRIRTGNGAATQTGTGVTGDRAFIFANGGFGTIQAGVINGLSDEYGIIGPNVEGIAGGPDNNTVYFLNGANTVNGNALLDLLPSTTNNFRAFASGDAGTKIIYLTPTFSGFQAGVSYMPRTGDVNQSVNRRKNNGGYGVFQDVVEFGGLYKNEFGSVAVEASAFYQLGQSVNVAGTDFKDLSSVHAGANIGYAGFKFGGSYAYSGDSGYDKALTAKEKQEVWIVGAQYTTGPFVLAVDYLNSRGNDNVNGVLPGRADIWQGGVTYTVAPGLTTGLEYSYVNYDSKAAPALTGGANLDDHAHVIMLDTRLAF